MRLSVSEPDERASHLSESDLQTVIPPVFSYFLAFKYGLSRSFAMVSSPNLRILSTRTVSYARQISRTREI
jgi:hypothetical protein